MRATEDRPKMRKEGVGAAQGRDSERLPAAGFESAVHLRAGPLPKEPGSFGVSIQMEYLQRYPIFNSYTEDTYG